MKHTERLFAGLVAGLAVAALAVAMPASAQQQRQNEEECAADDEPGPCQPGNDVRTQRLISTTHGLAERVRGQLTQRFFPLETGGGTLAMMSYSEQEDDGTGGAFDQFEEQARPAPPKWNAWGDLTYTYSDRTSATDGFQGDIIQGAFGIDRQLGGGTVLGVMGSANTSSYDTQSSSGDGTLEGDGLGIGAYAGTLLGDKVFANGVIQYASTDNSFAVGGSSAEYDSQSLGVTGTLTGLFRVDNLRFSPKASLTYSSEWQDAYTETSGASSPSRQTETGVASVGFQTGYTMPMSGGKSLEPWVGAQLDWTFMNETTPAPAPTADPINDLDAKVSGGLNAALSETVSLSFKGSFSGLTTSDYLVTSIGGQLAGRF